MGLDRPDSHCTASAAARTATVHSYSKRPSDGALASHAYGMHAMQGVSMFRVAGSRRLKYRLHVSPPDACPAYGCIF